MALQDCEWSRSPICEKSRMFPFVPALHPLILLSSSQWNHLGHFAFIQYLLPLLTKTARENPSPATSVRIVNLASLGHKLMNKPDFSSIDGANKDYGSTWKRYGQSKLGNILFTSELQERLKGENIKVSFSFLAVSTLCGLYGSV